LQTFYFLKKTNENSADFDIFVVISILSSVNSMAFVLLMFLESNAIHHAPTVDNTDLESGELSKKLKKWLFAKSTRKVKLGLYMYHVGEIFSRVLVFALLGFAFGRYSFVVGAASLAIRVSFNMCYKVKDMSLGLLVASLVLDSVWSSLSSFRAASLLTLVEGVAFLLLAAQIPLRRSIKNSDQLWDYVIFLICFSYLLKYGLHLVVEKMGKYSSDEGKRAKYSAKDDKGAMKEFVHEDIVNPVMDTGFVSRAMGAFI